MAGFAHVDRVRDVRSGTKGTVHFFELSAEDRAEGCAEGEVRWDGTCVADELSVAERNGITAVGSECPFTTDGEHMWGPDPDAPELGDCCILCCVGR